ncbi:AKAP7 2'5' RNA ligase-like domain-domain-containing protein [Clohesyomyces aquaticus]|uniref:AKAP7 2'5' RNA ligase-like domain-domain-containing protein n=1 Tax=Clohesyomyces aquaticus TaxID=1231657 RepID=A0A1Y2A8D1_9PLEO|nr:AKAP7 2'5' RNA ligase-like domain-domain-containing protein [Clohesyomyces aquaticus]
MGKKKGPGKGAYNDFLDGERLRDNADIKTTLQGSGSGSRAGHVRGRGKGRREKKPQLTHFLCLPLVNTGIKAQLHAALEKFKQELGTGLGVSEKAVRPVGTLHLTLGVMSLDSPGVEEVGKVLEALDLGALVKDAGTMALFGESVKEAEVEAQKPDEFKPLRIDLKALLPMQQPHKTSTLYAEPMDATGRIIPFAETLREHFTEKGFLVPDTRPLKLHATIVNTIYAKPGRQGRGQVEPKAKSEHKSGVMSSQEQPHDPCNIIEANSDAEAEVVAAKERSEGHGPNAKSWLRFDASTLIERYKDFVWAENVCIDRVQVCKMGATKILGEDGDVVDEAYECVFEKMI